jgi:hypothetical protein
MTLDIDVTNRGVHPPKKLYASPPLPFPPFLRGFGYNPGKFFKFRDAHR